MSLSGRPDNAVAAPPKNALTVARALGQSGRFPEMLSACRQIAEIDADSVEALLGSGALLLDFGFLARATECFERVRALAPNDPRAVINLANLARECGGHAESRRRFPRCRTSFPTIR